MFIKCIVDKSLSQHVDSTYKWLVQNSTLIAITNLKGVINKKGTCTESSV